MKRILAVLGVLAAPAALAGCVPEGGPADAAAPGAPPCEAEFGEAFGAWADAGFSGSVALSTGGRFDCLAAYGTADPESGRQNTPDTVFAIGSVSKSFTAAAVLGLAEEGALSLDDPAGGILPELDGPAAEATVEQLLLHTGGLTGSHGEDHEPLDREQAIAAIGRLERAFDPGTDFLYSNGGYTLLALIIDEVSEAGYREHMAAEVLPLPGGGSAGGFWDGEPAAPGPRAVGRLDGGGTGAAGDFAGPHWALSGGGDLAMTMEQLAAWTHALFTGAAAVPGPAEGSGAPRFEHGDGTAEVPGWAALDETVYGAPVLMSAGGGGDTGQDVAAVWLPETERAVAVASNGPEVTAEELLEAVGPALLAGEAPPVPERPADADPAELAAAEGSYALGGDGAFEVRADGGGLTVAASGPDAVAALFPLPGEFGAGDAAAHEKRVRALLDGASREGREERAALESDFGEIAEVEIDGTLVQDGELRTYVVLGTGEGEVGMWYALDRQGGIAAAEGPVDPPSLRLVPSGEGRYRPDDPTGAGPRVSVAFEDGRMTVSGPSGSATAGPADRPSGLRD